MKKVIILAAGLGTRIRPLTNKIPKSLIKIRGKTIIEYQLEGLHANGIKDIVVVIGHLGHLIKEKLGNVVKYVENKEYATSNSGYSLWLVRDEIKNGFVSLNSDLLFHSDILKKLLEDESENALMIDKKLESDCDMMKVKMEGRLIKHMSKEMGLKEASGKAVGPAKFSKEGATYLIKMMEEVFKKEGKNVWAYRLYSDFSKKRDFYGVEIDGLEWCEIDDYEDLKKAEDKYRT
jgi:choline kinase